MNETTFTILDDKKTLEVKRTFSAPIDTLWSAYTEADKIAQWWGPKGWVTEVKAMNFTEGGHWLYCMTCKDEAQGEWFGQSSCGKGVFGAIHPKVSFEYTDYFTDENGEITPGMPVSTTVLRFSELDNKTTITSTTVFESAESLHQVMEMGMQEGFTQTWDNLENFLRK